MAQIEQIKNQIAARLHQWGVSADFLTYAGLVIALASGLLAYEGQFFWAGAALLFSGVLDLLDGAVARQSKVRSPFGGILDSSLDRYGDAFILGGVLFYCFENYYVTSAVLAVSALSGSFLISYVRARAESVVPQCRVGFWERGERLVFLALGLLFGNLPLVLWVLAFGTHLTVLHRLVQAKRSVAGRTGESPGLLSSVPAFLKLSSRSEAPYWVKCGLLFLMALFVRVPFR